MYFQAIFQYILLFRTAFEKGKKIIGLHFNLEMDLPHQPALEVTELEIEWAKFEYIYISNVQIYCILL